MSKDHEDDAQSSGKQMITRVAAVLRALEGNTGGMSLAQIAGSVGLPRSTVQRIVTSLEAEKLLSVAPGGSGVRLGATLLRLAASVHRDILSIARPHLEALGKRVDESVQLAVDNGDGNTTVIEQYVPNRILRVVMPTGFILPIHSTAHGKALLATMDDAEVARLLAARMPRQTAKTVVERRLLLEHLGEVRRTGFAVDQEEQVEGICAIGAVIRTGWGQSYGIAIPVPAVRFYGREQELQRQLAECRDAIQAQAGGG